MSEFPSINWTKNEKNKYKTFWDGSVFLVALRVKNNATQTQKWEFDKVRFNCDGEDASLEIGDSGEPYDAWTWEDFEYFALLEGDMPGTEPPREGT